jgi:hypothetical protein
VSSSADFDATIEKMVSSFSIVNKGRDEKGHRHVEGHAGESRCEIGAREGEGGSRQDESPIRHDEGHE